MHQRRLRVASLILSLVGVMGTGCGGSNDVDSTSSPLVATSKGVLQTDAGKYRSPGTVTVTVADADLNLDPAVKDAAHVSVLNVGTGQTLNNVKLTETDVNAGIFVGSFDLVLESTKGKLTAANGDTIQITYHDANDGTGQAVDVAATAAVDNTSPDLYMTALSGPASANAGDSITVYATVTNAPGGQPTYVPPPNNGFYVGYYLSTNQVYDGSDVRVGDTHVSWSLGAGESTSLGAVVTLPTNLPGGTYYLLAVADDAGSYSAYSAGGNIAELSETNNVLVGNQITVSP